MQQNLCFYLGEIIIFKKNPKVGENKKFDNVLFGGNFTDHMFEVDWTIENGWELPEIKPFGNLSIVSLRRKSCKEMK